MFFEDNMAHIVPKFGVYNMNQNYNHDVWNQPNFFYIFNYQFLGFCTIQFSHPSYLEVFKFLRTRQVFTKWYFCVNYVANSTDLESSSWCASSWRTASGWTVCPVWTKCSARRAAGWPNCPVRRWASPCASCWGCSWSPHPSAWASNWKKNHRKS